MKSYLAAAGGFGEAEVVRGVALPQQSPLAAVQAWAEGLLSGGGGPDPFYAVVARRL